MGDTDAASNGLGGRLGGRLASLLVQAHVAAKGQTAGIQAQVGRLIWDEFFRGTGAELRGTMGDLFDQLARHPDTGDSLRPILAFLAAGEGEFASFVGASVTGSIISGGLGDLINNWLAPVVHNIIGQEPFAELQVGDVAQAKARGINIGAQHEIEAARAGYNLDRFNALVDMHRPRPDVTTLLDMANRGLVSFDAARGGLLQLGFREGDIDSLIGLARTVLTPATLADMVVRGIMPEDQAQAVAAQTGVTPEDFHAMVLDTGEAIGLQDMVAAYRRGVINLERLQHGIRESRYRDEWADVILALAQQPMTTADAVEAAVQGQMTLADSQRVAEENGLLPAHWQILYNTAGNPPGVQQMVADWHRGVLTRAQLVQGIQESRLKNKYIESTIAGSVRIPPERSIVSLVAKGGLTPAEGTNLLLMLGYTPEVTAALIAEAHATKTTRARTLTESMVTTLYEDQAMTAAEARTALDGLGYDNADIDWLLALADANRTHKYQTAAVGRISSSYVKGLSTAQDALLALQALGVPSTQSDQLFAYWDIERTTVTKTLTEAQVISAAKHSFITLDDAAARLQGMGYGDVDVAILLAPLAPPPTTPATGTGA